MDEIEGISLLKIPLLKFIYFCFLESEKISEDFKKYSKGFLKFLFNFLKNFIYMLNKNVNALRV